MPRMFRPGGVRADFKSLDEGQKAGYYATFREMAADVNENKKFAAQEPNQPAEKPTKKPAAKKAKSKKPAAANDPMPDVTQEDLLEQEESPDAESGVDKAGLCPAED